MRPPPVPPKQWDTFDRTSLKASERIHPLPSENLHKESKEILVKATKDSPAVSVYSKGINSRKTTPARGGMYMKVLYDYDADEKTSLSLRQGDIIQVITQLESGWWEGVLNDVCGWFPSNYCVVVQTPPEEYRTPKNDDSFHATFDESSEDEVLLKDTAGSEDGFWIPQATPDGRLFYFNTLTGVSTMELPLESPVAASPNETIPELKPMEGEDAAFRIPRSTPDRTLFSFNSKTGETRREPPKNSLIPPSSHHKISEPTVLPFMITSKDLQKRPERQPATYGWELEHTVLETDNGEPFSVCKRLPVTLT
jgi:hypothetical protein